MDDSVVNDEMKVQYRLIRRKGRNLSVRVHDDGSVVVNAPLHISAAVVESFVRSRTGWIERKVHDVGILPKALPEHTWTTGDRFLVLGNEVTLCVVRTTGENPPAQLAGSTLTVCVGPRAGSPAIRRVVLEWYETLGLSVYRVLVDAWCARLGLGQFVPISLSSFPKRLGSCSHDGTLRFATRSLMLPPDILEYLALHEVAHLLHFNHGSLFKQTLAKYMPDWRRRQRMMRDLRVRTSRI